MVMLLAMMMIVVEAALTGHTQVSGRVGARAFISAK